MCITVKFKTFENTLRRFVSTRKDLTCGRVVEKRDRPDCWSRKLSSICLAYKKNLRDLVGVVVLSGSTSSKQM